MKKLIAILLTLCLLPVSALAQESADDEIWYEPGPEMTSSPEEIRAEQWLLAADPKAKDAENIYLYFSNETDGAWAFCCDDVGLYFTGEFWYLNGEEAYSLGRGKQFWHWELLNTTPEVFCCSIGKPEVRRANASILVDGKPLELAGADSFHKLAETKGCMYGWVDGFDYAFLCVDDNELCEVEAAEISMEQFMSLDGAQGILDVLEQYKPGARVVSALYRSTGVVTLNIDDPDDGKCHMYAWITEDGLWTHVDDWHYSLMNYHNGEGSAARNTGLRVIKSELPE